MGNCLCRRPRDWAAAEEDRDEEYWEEAAAAAMPEKAVKLPVEDDGEKGAASWKKGGMGSTEVRIRISRKQLEELLRRAEAKGLPAQAVMADLVNLGQVCFREIGHGQPWRPKLHSIPEEDE
ncbi:hypothetical protein AXF42_Ash010985 [Apostasia shenzhenica]|uniref:Uncharacterized protein n=1 Tax=Apostasia shenzhenica TaxID=1088818 RepID=A0A2H9ZQS2_9ASPA|nr:hypothetical protein AXF42_Ash010985 [Apostasia shenzhenica]